ncbi:MAG: hypothetical protein HY735_27310 [Verrucomicrobia bacterium]|nr:hypothetical protein [Verrucomicrobiota bacterium]
MAWIKRNLFLVIGGVVALGLLGLAGYFLYTKFAHDQAVTEQLTQATDDLKRLVSRDPHPGTEKVDNISAAKAEQKRLQAFLGQVHRYFSRSATNQPTSRDFRALLDTTVAELRNNAERAGVQLPEDYWFTFTAQKALTVFPTNILGTLTAQLQDIQSLCRILFDAKIISLEKVRRTSAGQEDGGGGSGLVSFGMTGNQDYLDSEVKGATNQWAVVMPYEITFQGFSSELAEVLEGLIRSPQCFVVKNLIVERADAQSTTDESLTGVTSSESTPAMNPYGRYGQGPMMNPLMNRYGMGMSPDLMRRYGLGTRMPMAPTAPPKPRGSTLLEEKALRITVSVSSVKLKPSSGK